MTRGVPMRGYRFFEEFSDGRFETSSGNVIAVDITGESFVQEGGVCYGAVVAFPDSATPNSPVLGRLFNAEYLGARCRRISESRARSIHPRLFEYLDAMA
ncbi:MAG TPA: hypothetical protein VIQ74_11760 [Gemmatimonadaceae bacterium]|jgi:hypothetical protein